MPELYCSVGNCRNNRVQYCRLNQIIVEGPFAEDSHTTYCTSFQSVREYEKTEDMVSQCTNQIEIRCEAQYCKYNQGHKCHASRIYVNGCGADTVKSTECKTFRFE